MTHYTTNSEGFFSQSPAFTMAKEQFAAFLDFIKNPPTTPPTPLSTAFSCDNCGNSFKGIHFYRRKKACGECTRPFCMSCLMRGPDRILRCRICSILTMRPPMREQLLMLRVRDLQAYLIQHSVSTRGCVEKEDLVNLLLRYASTPGNPSILHPHPRGAPCYNMGGESSSVLPENSVPPPSSSRGTTEPPATHNPQVQVQPPPAQEALAESDSSSSSSSSDTSFEMVPRPDSSCSQENTFPDITPPTSSGHTSVSTNNRTNEMLEEIFEEFSDLRTTSTDALVGSGHGSQVNLEAHESGPEQMSGSVPMSGATQEEPQSGLRPESTAESGHDGSEPETGHDSDSMGQPSTSQSNTANSSPNLLRGSMAAISSESDLEAMSVKQLKDLLLRHRVNYRGCCEKAELVERAKRLYRDYCASRAELEKLDIEELCKVCMDAPVECVMLECGHMATCTDCGRQLSECPICRQYVVRIVRTFKA